MKKLFSAASLLNGGIYILLLLSLWGIFSIGVKILPLVETETLSPETVGDLNNVYVNLSYSYLVGFMVYIFTTKVPFYFRRKIYLPVIKKSIERHLIATSATFWSFYRNQQNLIDIKGVDVNNPLWRGLLISFEDIPTEETKNQMKQDLLNFAQTYTTFINSIIPYEPYLNDKQLELVNEIKFQLFFYQITNYIYCIEEKVISQELFRLFKNYIDKLNALKEAF